MIYNKEPLELNSPVAFWLNFPNEERVFWVDRQSDRIVVGAKRLATVKDMKIAIITLTCFMEILFLRTLRTLNGLAWVMK